METITLTFTPEQARRLNVIFTRASNDVAMNSPEEKAIFELWDVLTDAERRAGRNL
jgi:hypothetical protein